MLPDFTDVRSSKMNKFPVCFHVPYHSSTTKAIEDSGGETEAMDYTVQTSLC